jgi:hypothetical protein
MMGMRHLHVKEVGIGKSESCDPGSMILHSISVHPCHHTPYAIPNR